MKFLILLIFPALAFAKEPNCGKMNAEWFNCDKAEDCVLADDGCSNKRTVANKEHVKDVEKFYACVVDKKACSKVPVSPFSQALRCDSYGIKAVKRKSEHKTCLSLGSLADYAVNNGDVQKLESVIAESKNVDMSLSHIDETPLTLAALNRQTEVVRWLLSKGAKVNKQTTNGYTALMFAVTGHSNEAQMADTIKVLLAAGADKSLKNHNGETVLDQAKYDKNAAALKLLQ